jgi:hypothetical protein
MAYALRSVCIHHDSLCRLNEQQYDQFEQSIKQTDKDDIDALYTLGTAWALWIQKNKSDWNAIAQLDSGESDYVAYYGIRQKAIKR